MNFLLKLFLLSIGIFSLISTSAAAESFPLKELDCDWDESSVTIPNHLTVKIDNAAIWGYHAYTADLNQDGKPDYLRTKPTRLAENTPVTAKSCFSCRPPTDTPKRKWKLSHFQSRIYSSKIRSFSFDELSMITVGRVGVFAFILCQN